MRIDPRREDGLIELFLSSYEKNSWRDCELDWRDRKSKGEVEVVAKRCDGETVAIEHTLIQPFAKDKEQYSTFDREFSGIEKDKSLSVPNRVTYLYLPCETFRKGFSHSMVSAAVYEWLKANVQTLPTGRSIHVCPIGDVSDRRSRTIIVEAKVNVVLGYAGAFRIRRYGAFALAEVIEKALNDKLPKLVKTDAKKRILLLERDQPTLSESRILSEIDEAREKFSNLAMVDEIWFAETMFYEVDRYVRFEQYDNCGLVRAYDFLNGRPLEVAQWNGP